MGQPSHPSRWGGAIARWELTRLARRGLPTTARLLVGLLLFTALAISYLADFPPNLELLHPSRVQNELSKFGREFVLTFLLVQAGVVLLVTPLFVAGSIVEETERRTLEFLLATDLSPREIILGKLWPRLLLVLGLVMTGWPILAVTQVWGGVDIVFVTSASAVVLAEMWAVAGISAACTVGRPGLRKAMIRSYAGSVLALTLPLCTSPAVMIVALADPPGAYEEALSIYNWVNGDGRAVRRFALAPPPQTAVLVFIIVVFAVHLAAQFLIGFWGLRRATYKLRHAAYYSARVSGQVRPRKLQHWEKHPPVPEGSPLIWKELHLSGQTSRFVRMLSLVPWVVWLCVCSVLMIVGWAAVIGEEADDILQRMNELIRWGGGAVICLMCLMVGLHAAGAVARERQQETLDDLLTIPRPRRQILAAKWIGAMAKARGIALGALAIPLVGVIAEGLSYWAVLPLLLAAGAFVACSASFGLWLSVRVRTVQRATGLWLLLVGLWVGGTFLAAETAYEEQRAVIRVTSSLRGSKPAPLIWDRALNPLLAWSELTFRIRSEEAPRYYWQEWRDGEVDGPSETLPSLLGVGLYWLLAWAFYRLAARRFERQGRE